MVDLVELMVGLLVVVQLAVRLAAVTVQLVPALA